MKKVALSLLTFVLAGALAFAADTTAETGVKNPVDVTFSANASATFGVDLDNGTTGITNAAEAKLKLTILPEATSEKGTDNKVGGYIKIEKLKIATSDPNLKTYSNTTKVTTLALDANNSPIAIGTDDKEYKAADGKTYPFPAGVTFKKYKTVDTSAYTGSDNILTASVGDITAKIFFNDLYVKIYAKPDAKVDYAALGADPQVFPGQNADSDIGYLSGRYGATRTNIALPNASAQPFAPNGGITIGYVIPNTAEISLEVGSAFDWADATTFKGNADKIGLGAAVPANANQANTYSFKPQVTVTAIENLNLNVGAVFSMDKAKNTDLALAEKKYAMAFGGNAGYTLKDALGAGYNLIPFAGLDVVLPAAAPDPKPAGYQDLEIGYEVNAGAKLRWPGKWDDSGDYSGLMGAVQLFKSGAASGDVSINTVVYAYSEAGKVVPNLEFRAGVGVYNLTAAEKVINYAKVARYAFDAFGKYEVSTGIKPWGEVTGENVVTTVPTKKDGTAASMFLRAGVDFEKLIPMTTFSVEYDSNNMNGGPLAATVDASKDAVNQNLGQIKFTAKVEY